MNINDAKKSIAAARAEIQKLMLATVDEGKKNAAAFKALPGIAQVDNALVRADEKLDGLPAKLAPKVKKDKAAKK